MENSDPSSHSNRSKRTHRRNSNSHVSISDTESTTSQPDSFHSPLRFDSPIRSDDPYFQPGNENSNVKYFSPVPSPGNSGHPAAGGKGWRPWPQSEKPNSENRDITTTPPVLSAAPGKKVGRDFAAKGTEVVVGVNRFVREEPPPGVKKLGPVSGVGVVEEAYGDGGERKSSAAVDSTLRRSERSVAVKKGELGIRVFEVIACLVSFSVMAADKTQGWAGDSFDRYKEYRYCLAVNVIGFVYSGFQAFDLAYYLGTEKHFISHHLRYHFDFSMDQILAYLLMSASSSAATRVDDWITNWGKDQFTLMASASISMSFLAFVAFALSSLTSGYNLCNRDST